MKIWQIALGAALVALVSTTAIGQNQPNQTTEPVEKPLEKTKNPKGDPQFGNSALQIELEMTEFVRGVSDLDFHDVFEEKVALHISGARLDAPGFEEWRNFFRRGGKSFMLRNVQVKRFDAKSARVEVSYRIHDGEYETGLERTETLDLKHEIVPWSGERRWRVVPHASGAARWRFYTLAGVAFFGSQPEGVLPLLRAQISLQNLQHLAAATRRLRQAYKGRFRLENKAWREELKEFFDPNNSGTKFVSFDEVAAVPGTTSFYNFNDYLSSRRYALLKKPARTVLFFERKSRKPSFRYSDKAAICFADGQVKLVSRAEAKKLIWKL